MGVAIKFTCLALLAIGHVTSAALPVGKCASSDKACLKSAVQKMVPIFMAGMPDYGVEVLEPVKLYNINFDIEGLKYSLSDATLTGLKDCIIDDVEWDAAKKVFIISYHTDISAKGAYKASGHISDKPITGDGELNMELKNLHIKLFIHYDIVKKGDKQHVKPTKFNYDFDVKDNAHYHMSNLYNGDQQKSDEMLNFINSNWKSVSTSFSPPLIDSFTKKVFECTSNLFDKLALEDIAVV